MKIDNVLVERGAEALVDVIYGSVGRADIPPEAWNTMRNMSRAVLEDAGPVFVRRAVAAVEAGQNVFVAVNGYDCRSDLAFIYAREAIRELLRHNDTIEGYATAATFSKNNDSEAPNENDEP